MESIGVIKFYIKKVVITPLFLLFYFNQKPSAKPKGKEIGEMFDWGSNIEVNGRGTGFGFLGNG